MTSLVARIFDWLWEHKHEPSRQSMLAFLAGWENGTDRLHFECSLAHDYIKLTLKGPEQHRAESYLFGIHSDTAVNMRLACMAYHIRTLENQDMRKRLKDVLDISRIGRDC